MLVFFILFIQLSCPALAITEDQAVHCILGEARGESYIGKIAVAEVLRRRGSRKGFVGCYTAGIPAVCQRYKSICNDARKAWRVSKHTNYSRNATHFDSVHFKRPWWSKKMQLVCKIGNHLFWRDR